MTDGLDPQYRLATFESSEHYTKYLKEGTMAFMFDT